MFFSEEMTQETFANSGVAAAYTGRDSAGKSFLLLFFKKEDCPYYPCVRRTKVAVLPCSALSELWMRLHHVPGLAGVDFYAGMWAGLQGQMVHFVGAGAALCYIFAISGIGPRTMTPFAFIL